MKTPLDCEDSLDKSFRYWLGRYLRFKLSSLLASKLKSPQELALIQKELSGRVCLEAAELSELAKRARRTGLGGIATYFTPLLRFHEQLLFLGLFSMKQIDEDVAVQVLWAISAKLSDASKKNYRIAVLNFFKFLSRQNRDEDGSFAYDIELKNFAGVVGNKGNKLPEFMSREQMKSFLEELERHDFKDESDRLLIKILLFTGLRVSELLALRAKDFELQGETFSLRVRGKGNKYRVVLLHQKALGACVLTLKRLLASKELLFEKKNGKVISQPSVYRRVCGVLAAAGICKEKNGPHMLRHSFATFLYQQERDILLVQEALGHASLDTSRIYTHFDSEKLRQAADATLLLAKDG